uniref:RING-type E3 ubiquitin transferase n=1 Tax=Wollemia nobilis TaxID=56998 RepID=A0A0C9RRT7_9CONI
MQGQRNTMHPMSESFDLGNISDQNNMNIESHIYQGERINLMAAPNLPDYQVSGNSSNCNFRNIGSHAGSSSSFVNGWASGSASNAENIAGQSCTAEDKLTIGWNSVSNMQSNTRIDERQTLDTNVVPLESGAVNILNNPVMDDRLHLHSSCSYGTTSDCNSYNFSVNQPPVSNEGRSYMDPSCFTHPTALVGSEPEQMTFASGSGVGCLPENSNGRANHSMDSRRVSCKRKNAEGISGSSSLDAAPSSSQWDEGNLRFIVPGRQNIGNSLSISVPSGTHASERPAATHPGERPMEEPVIPNPGAGVSDVASDYRAGLSMVGQSEGSHRNVRMRFNSINQQEPNFPQVWPVGNAGRPMSEIHPHSSHSRRLFTGDLSPDTGPGGASTSAPPRQPSVFHVPSGIQRSLHSLGWNDNNSMPRMGNASGSTAVGRERLSSIQEETSSRNMGGIANNAWLVANTESRPATHESGNWIPVNRNTNEPRSVTNSVLHSSSVMPWGPHHVPLTQASRRSAGNVQGSGLPSSINRPSHILPSRTVSSSDVPLPPGTGFHGPQYLRSTLLMERQGDGILGVPFGSLQALAGEGEGRHRLMSEIRNVLELMRRGENLRFEDILILDQSTFYSAADIHDQHRDMRLDVDNMSYEELLALEERIGNVSTGLTEETVSKCLKKSIYLSCKESDEPAKKQPEDEICSICREEYQDNEELGILDCGHIHHSDCIKKWLLLKNICPICKKTALNT